MSRRFKSKPQFVPLDRSRTTPHGFWRFGANYLLAARKVDVGIRSNQSLYFPALQLYGTSIELSLKGFLLQRGCTLKDVKGLSHRLSEILTKARARKLGRLVKMSQREVDAVDILAITYSSHQLRYIYSGAVTLPQLVDVARAAEELVLGLEFYCTGQKGRIAKDLQ